MILLLVALGKIDVGNLGLFKNKALDFRNGWAQAGFPMVWVPIWGATLSKSSNLKKGILRLGGF
jgi:hypothetical protein